MTHGCPAHTLAKAVGEQLNHTFGPEPRDFQGPDFLARLNSLRAELSGPSWREQCRDFLESLGIRLEEFALDRFRLRGLAPGADQIPAAAAAFYAHRDVWYANPQAQINLWMPLHEVSRQDSFGFYPDLFQTPVENDSEQFDYAKFQSEGGFQSTVQSLVHPRWLAPEQPEPPYAVELRQGELLLFSAAHLHRSLPNRSGRIRFSLDMRLVHRGDAAAGRGAPNCDNRSRGSVLSDYVW
ncbi:MAG: phytanoyl-CoA dioxygenase family protein [Candidatus Eremiobacteraeota bacterium]|nr:phytanoyl-CoA dioxygenase family protein [Candidatus Eremiobacteraeota bacterium]MCW5868657.1 phytanoyl-CoA dioxygenase family protein [Candidatus Eremiobacteraeota bacterium]